MIFKGKAHRFGDDINTDYVISGKYKSKILDYDELCKHIMEDIDPGFYERLASGDFIVAGKNFGCGSSRETAPMLIKRAGVSAVIAKSFARIFFRNAISIGLRVVECDTDPIEDGDMLEVDFTDGVVAEASGKYRLESTPLPPALMKCLDEGGMSANFKKYGVFKLD